MARKFYLGGRHDGLYVKQQEDGYFFGNETYSMMLQIFKEDIEEYLEHPNRSGWGLHSYSNTVAEEDKKIIKDYLIKKRRKYKTVTGLLKSRSKYKAKILRDGFSLNEIIQYKIGKEKTDEVESCS